jgi:hypothetical protein
MTLRQRLPNRRASETFAFRWAGMDFVATVSRFENGELAEVFLSNGKINTDSNTVARDSAVVARSPCNTACPSM